MRLKRAGRVCKSGRCGVGLAVLLCLGACALFLSCPAAAQTAIPPQPWAPWMEETPPPLPRQPGQAHPVNPAPAFALAQRSETAPAAAAALSPSEWETLRRDLLESSALERMYSGRIVDRLEQFGYDLFDRARRDETGQSAMPAGAAQDNVILNFGDKIQITFRGQRDDQKTYTVDNEGLVIVPDLAPIPAAGRSLGRIRDALEAEAGRLHNTQVFVSLVAVQRINILVVGHVARPGRQTLTAFNNILDALSAAGGIEKTGTLRQIKLVRQGRSMIVDLYGLLIYGGGEADLMLQDGDRLIVPPIGPTVAVSGEVKRPGIYEILPLPRGLHAAAPEATDRLSLDDMLALSGGVLAPGRNRFLKLEIGRGGEESTVDVADSTRPLFGDGCILVVARGVEKRSGSIELRGHSRRPGLYALDDAPSLHALLDTDGVTAPDIYPLIGVIERYDPQRLTTALIDFPLQRVLGGGYDEPLREDDVVHLFAMDQIAVLDRAPDSGDEGGGGRALEQGSADPDPDAEPIDDPAIRDFLREHAVRLRGAVRRPGIWPVAAGATLDMVLAAAGGLSLDADAAGIEITGAGTGRSGPARRMTVSFADGPPAGVVLRPGDTVRVNRRQRMLEDKTVKIVGEIAHPGVYDLLPGERLSALLARAGGLTPDAYPEGAIFSRESERKAEEARFKAAARDLERAIAALNEEAPAETDRKPDAARMTLARDLAAQLRAVQAVGRITVEADPAILSAQPELDILLEAGDRIFVPKRPLTVRVTGEVLSPAALQFRSGKDARDYIMQAGGFSFNADKGRVFVVYPDGSAQPLDVDVWNHRATMIPPGSSIVVPRDPKPFDFLESAEKVTQIVSNLALTGIWLDDLDGE